MALSVQDRIDSYTAAFDAVERGMPAPAWLRSLRGGAFERFQALGFPTTRHEEWRFTNVGPIAGTPFAMASDGLSSVGPALAATAGIDAIGGLALVLVGGRFAPGAVAPVPSPRGVVIRSLADALAGEPERLAPHLGRLAGFDQHAFRALNTALFVDGLLVEIAPNLVREEPIHLVHVSTGADGPTMAHPRVLVVVGENSQVRIVETFVSAGEGRRLTNAVSEFVIAPGANVDHYRIQRETSETFHVGSAHVEVGRSAAFSSQTVTLGGAIVRNDTVAVLAGPGADCTLNGIYVADGESLVDNHTEIDHAAPHCTSHEVYKGILGGRARGVFNGKIKVRPAAQKTDAKQTNKTLLVSGEAQINTKPQLEILADDVKCTHGATVGQLSEDALFYLRARGIGRDEARDLLIRAFAGEVVGRMALAPAREHVDRLIAARLAGMRRAGVR